VKKIGVHSYLLLELLIALTLVTLCLLPFIGIPSKAVKEELLSMQRLQLQHMSDRTYAGIKERMYQQDISWDQLVHAEEKKMILIEDQITLPIKELAAQRFGRKCYLSSRYKQSSNDEAYCLVTIKVVFRKIPNAFFAFKKKKKMTFIYKIIAKQSIEEIATPTTNK
jgi:hypothetical protein